MYCVEEIICSSGEFSRVDTQKAADLIVKVPCWTLVWTQAPETEPEEVAPAIVRANAIDDRPVFVDFHVWPEANVMPMIPAGKSVDDLIMEA